MKHMKSRKEQTQSCMERVSRTVAHLIDIIDDYIDEMVEAVVRFRYSENEEEYTSDEHQTDIC